MMETIKHMAFLNDIIDTWSQIYTDLPQSRRVKRLWIKLGFKHQMSFYGVMTEREKELSEYRRIEILSNIPWTEKLFFSFYIMFKTFIPDESYTIWIYDHHKGLIKPVGLFR